MRARARALAGGGALLLALSLAGWLAWPAPAGAPEATRSRSESLEDVVRWLLACRRGGEDGAEAGGAEACTGVLYVWSDLMPLSREGIAQVRAATEGLGLGLTLLDAAELEARAAVLFPSGARPVRAAVVRGPAARGELDALVRELLLAGATAHNPALLVVRDGRLVGSAILGYKTADAYLALVRERLEGGAGAARGTEAEGAPGAPGVPSPGLRPEGAATPAASAWSRDYPVRGRPGAYFRSVPGRQTLAYEAGGRVQLLALASGSTALGPGYIDFVPTPDGRMFVTPAERRGGLAFYDAEDVFRAAARGAGRDVRPVYTDREMRDQYPSVGILSSTAQDGGTRVVYRVLTSWFDRIVYRDYEVTTGRGTAPGSTEVRPLGDPVVACPTVSIPIMSPDGKELAGRDEGTATTRIFALEEGCRPVADLRVQSGKVAWAPDGRVLAFAIPRGAMRDGGGTLWVGGDDPDAHGIFLYRRDGGRIERVAGSEDAHRIAFPEFVGSDSLAFQLSPGSARDETIFRLVCCVR